MKYETELNNYINRATLFATCTAEYKDGEDPNETK